MCRWRNFKPRRPAGELNSSYFDSLVSDDLVDDLLSWLADPKGTRDRWEPGRWEILCSRCIADYGFDPARDGELVGAEKLGLQAKPIWKTAWKRFAAAPLRYPGLLELLRKAKPTPKPGDLVRVATGRVLAAGQRGRRSRRCGRNPSRRFAVIARWPKPARS